MLWKKDKPMARDSKTGRLRSLSITARLNLLFTLSGIAMLIIVSVFLYWVLISNMHKEDNEVLLQKTGRLVKALNKYNIEVLDRELTDSTEFHSLVFKFRILDNQGMTLLESPGMRDSVPASVFPAPWKGLAEFTGGTEWTAQDGTVYLLSAIWTEVRTPSPQKAIFQTAYDVTGDYKLIIESARKLGVMFILGILFFSIMGNFIVRKGLRPLREIADSIKTVTGNHLNERITPKEWPRELRTLAGSFNQMLDRLEGSFARLSEFSTNIAHEFRTPINNLMGETEVCISRSRTADEYRQVLESNLEEITRLTRLINNLLFLARSENPSTSIKCSHFDAVDEIKTICDSFSATAKGKGVILHCNGNGFLIAEQTLFRRAVSNLLDNALQHTPPGGKIEISARQPDDKGIEITVGDTGSGIAPEHLPYIFKRFYRGDRERSDYLPGTGLGLSIVKQIMDLHCGIVTVRSNPGKGTIVILTFPPAA